MPLYEYECDDCGEITEVIRPMWANVIECPKCGGTARQLINGCNYLVKDWVPNPLGASKEPVRADDEERLENQAKKLKWR